MCVSFTPLVFLLPTAIFYTLMEVLLGDTGLLSDFSFQLTNVVLFLKTAFSSQESIMAAQTLSRIRKPFFRAKLIKHGSAVETSPSWQRFIMKQEYLFGCQPAISGTINQAYLCNVSFNQRCLACSVPFDIICMQQSAPCSQRQLWI